MGYAITVIYNMLNQLINFVTPWGFTFGVIIIAPTIIILMFKGVKKLL